MPLLPGDKRQYGTECASLAEGGGACWWYTTRYGAMRTNGRVNATGNLRKMNLISWKRTVRDLRPERTDNFARRTCTRESDKWQSLNETKRDETRRKQLNERISNPWLTVILNKMMILFRAVKLLFKCHRIGKCKKILLFLKTIFMFKKFSNIFFIFFFLIILNLKNYFKKIKYIHMYVCI